MLGDEGALAETVEEARGQRSGDNHVGGIDFTACDEAAVSATVESWCGTASGEAA